jgi:hypothetical protein
VTKPSLVTFNYDGEVFGFDVDKIEWQIMSIYRNIYNGKKYKKR